MRRLAVWKIARFGRATGYDMPIKLILLFLIVMAVVAMFGRLRFPGSMGKQAKQAAKTCPKCGRHRIGAGPCPCGKQV
jgi:hypothetical protein